jgi:hypothetical protein
MTWCPACSADVEPANAAGCGVYRCPVAPREVRRVEHDGFVGEVIGHYTTREGRQGVVLQQLGTKVVHVYREDRTTIIQEN